VPVQGSTLPFLFSFGLRYRGDVNSTLRMRAQYFFLTLANDQLDAQIFNTFITILYMHMFQAISCSSSGGQIVLIQHLVSSLSVSDRPVPRLRENCSAVLLLGGSDVRFLSNDCTVVAPTQCGLKCRNCFVQTVFSICRFILPRCMMSEIFCP